jgi:hypothetical protein
MSARLEPSSPPRKVSESVAAGKRFSLTVAEALACGSVGANMATELQESRMAGMARNVFIVESAVVIQELAPGPGQRTLLAILGRE